ncbi:hypothetical protein [Staphylospora marina]|uniref:hypothetical protein n=1 Tax=Staphylospora marina TaxID=2490858 RepID=UPI000F5BD526|nr:hypothetical protein [Staphylospora marina]
MSVWQLLRLINARIALRTRRINRRIRRLRESLLGRIRQLEQLVRQLQAQLQSLLDNPFAGEFADIRRQLLALVNRQVRISTLFGDVEGVVATVGTDFVELLSAGARIAVPYYSISTVTVEGDAP